jgi:hypothetical protein
MGHPLSFQEAFMRTKLKVNFHFLTHILGMSGSFSPELTGVPMVLKRPSSSPTTLLTTPFPQILDTLQEKWRAIERERASWEMEKCQFEVRIIELEGEKETEHRIRENLLRRIKMLEFALKEER